MPSPTTEPLSPDLGVFSHIEAIRAVLGPVEGLRLLDIGCGDSPLPRLLAGLGAECSGIDPFMPPRGWTPEGPGRWRILDARAEALPFETASIDAVLYIFSLHHVPGASQAEALGEARRVLRPQGRLYVAEPLAAGDFNDVIELFHDEQAVRAEAQTALAAARPLFARHVESAYAVRRRFDDFDAFATLMRANTRFNDYRAEDVVAPAVSARFASVAARTDGIFDQPVKLDVLG